MAGRAPKAAPAPTLDLEREIAMQGYDVIVGFDEVGRGALAGPAMVGAAAIRSADLLGGRVDVPAGVADSKLLTEHRREAIFDELTDWCAAYAVGSASNEEIDEWGIGYALGVAALRALGEAERALGLDGSGPGNAAARVGAILDGPFDYISKAEHTFDAPVVPASPHVVTRVKGDRSCATVATAAVIAKVTRDRLMVDLARRHPEWDAYGWASNKGYGSAAHRAAIAELGPTPLHRVSWHLV
ncbi:ribonuclease HII [Bifidobacterium avesanii]|uniref:Ribonuclease n=1 Tax=Bifidobacterium avesanii TaxID=1798157 RepID=A0A7K3TFA9_9BIFI|nr:ribonuclease HII [Bifidobacterium avesanii]KAB8294385.1 ribonuclease HII [Bifidobacterium avesanii]NEG77781.1 ribonuclease HII [Bifidobacterium avesanii]